MATGSLAEERKVREITIVASNEGLGSAFGDCCIIRQVRTRSYFVRLDMPGPSPFKHHRFPREIILCSALVLALSYEDVVELLAERGIGVDQSTVYRWVQKFGPEVTKRT